MLSERPDGRGVAPHRAFDPAGTTGRQAARDRHARGYERGALCFAHRLPMAAAAQGFSAAFDGLQLLWRARPHPSRPAYGLPRSRRP